MQVLSVAVEYLSEELAKQPDLLQHFRKIYQKKSYVSSRPIDGSKLDIFNPLFTAKRLVHR